MIQRLLHISDLHFGAEDARACHALLELAHGLRPQWIVCSGDLTQRATDSQFRQADAFLQALPEVPRLIVPGNHDLPVLRRWWPWGDAYRRYRQHIDAELEPLAQASPWSGPGRPTQPWHIVGINSCRRWLHAGGALSSVQIERARRVLDSAPLGTWPLVLVHHPLIVSRVADQGDRPRHHMEALRAWSRVPGTTVLGGHLHEPFVRRVVPDPAQPQADVWIVQAGTATSVRHVHGLCNSVSVLEDDSGRVPHLRRVVQWDFDPRAGRFIRAREHLVQADVGHAPTRQPDLR